MTSLSSVFLQLTITLGSYEIKIKMYFISLCISWQMKLFAGGMF